MLMFAQINDCSEEENKKKKKRKAKRGGPKIRVRVKRRGGAKETHTKMRSTITRGRGSVYVSLASVTCVTVTSLTPRAK